MRLKQIIITIFLFLLGLSVTPGMAGAPDSTDRETVFVLHGLASGKSVMWLLSKRLEKAGFTVIRVGYKSLKTSPNEIVEDVTVKINNSLPADGSTVHFVGHSLGGLIVRAYLDGNRLQSMGSVVLMGTPNKGTPFVDRYRDKWWMKFLGPTAQSLGTAKSSFPNSIPPPYYPVGIIAAVSDKIENDRVIPGKDDGIVPLEATKLSGMTDMKVFNLEHTTLCFNPDVAEAVISFLKQGSFVQE